MWSKGREDGFKDLEARLNFKIKKTHSTPCFSSYFVETMPALQSRYGHIRLEKTRCLRVVCLYVMIFRFERQS